MVNLRLATIFLVLLLACFAGAEEWKGFTVEPEDRCSAYQRGTYSYYPAILELQVAKRYGMKSRYTNKKFRSLDHTDLDHVVALSEAHDSGLCAASKETQRQFAQDLDNLALADPQLNRYQKSDKDAADWLPPQNKCWYVQTIMKVKKKYGLSIDKREQEALAKVLRSCIQGRENNEKQLCETSAVELDGAMARWHKSTGGHYQFALIVVSAARSRGRIGALARRLSRCAWNVGC